MSGYPTISVGLNYTQTNLVLTQNQINGLDPIVVANPNRKAIRFGGVDKTIKISLVSGQTTGMSYAASFRDGDEGNSVHIGAYYLSVGQDLEVGSTICIWEAS